MKNKSAVSREKSGSVTPNTTTNNNNSKTDRTAIDRQKNKDQQPRHEFSNQTHDPSHESSKYDQSYIEHQKMDRRLPDNNLASCNQDSTFEHRDAVDDVKSSKNIDEIIAQGVEEKAFSGLTSPKDDGLTSPNDVQTMRASTGPVSPRLLSSDCAQRITE